ncbi:MAG: hypothetical protein HP028_04020 [Clostridia bacterium]|nr:hypothetical protein [Clostridia bacterium]
MYNSAFPKIEYYLYNYKEISDRINKLNTQNSDLDYNHFNYGLWIRTKLNRGNSLENQVVNKINNECIIKKLNLWKKLIQEVLKKYKETDSLKYKFICLKYIKKLSDTEIEEILKIDKYKQKDIRANILHYIFLLCLKKNILREVK